MDDFLLSVDKNAKKMIDLYKREIKVISFAKGLEECIAQESQKINELKDIYLNDIKDIKFLSGTYFEDYSSFVRHQEIPDKYFIKGCSDFYFISHQWESVLDPDPNKNQFNLFKTSFKEIPTHAKESFGFWYDYCCAPQNNDSGERTEEENDEFSRILQVMHILTTLSLTVIIFADTYMDRSWCCAEWIFATRISPLMNNSSQIFPFHNAIKFRQLALVILYLTLDDSFKETFQNGDDKIVIAFINTLLGNTMELTESTIPNDKFFLLLTLHRHFWYHLRFIGLRTEISIGFQLLNSYDQAFVELLFKQFLFLSSDPELSWTKKASIEIDTMIFENPDPFKDLLFHGKKVEVISRTRKK